MRSTASLLVAALVLTLLAGCGSAPKSPSGRDGVVAADVPSDIAATPDATPRVEPIKPGGANKPYEVLGKSYTPETRDLAIREKGLASWYGKKFHGRRTASGELYNMYAMTAAHPTMPLPSYARVRNPKNGREIIVRINDRGPFHAGRIIDLSYTAAVKLGVQNGVAPVEVERLTNEAIRTGAWKRDDDTAIAAAEPAPAAAPAVEPVAAVSDPPVDAPVLPPKGATVADAGAARTPARAHTEAARGFWVQLGAFRERGGAETFQQRVADELDWLAPLMTVFGESQVFRLQAGPYASRDEAQAAAQRVRDALQLVPMVVERR
ncbi:septal ring lytic transglycosylase RlpA family protein [Caldimonas sp. KR1-144]|uniref:septal ring lytic transglycosylase RlpA family protein n=1 Tax=Caldimonas sp. KR1-144 TaxID=3400911 RepID=UPI003BFE6C21